MIAAINALHKTVAVPTTAVALIATKTLAYSVRIKAFSSNTKNVFISGTGGNLALSGFALAAGEELDIGQWLPPHLQGDPVDLNKIFVDAVIALEGVSVLYLEGNAS